VACVGSSVGGAVARQGWPGSGPAGLWSLPASSACRRCVPHRPRRVAGGRRWPRSSAIEAGGQTRRLSGAAGASSMQPAEPGRPIALDLTASLPHLHRGPQGEQAASTPGGGVLPGTPQSGSGASAALAAHTSKGPGGQGAVGVSSSSALRPGLRVCRAGRGRSWLAGWRPGRATVQALVGRWRRGAGR
jgi:hypothetical protein